MQNKSKKKERKKIIYIYIYKEAENKEGERNGMFETYDFEGKKKSGAITDQR